MSNLRPAPIFVADAKGIDFLNSLATPVDTPVEWLGSGEDLLAWLKQAKLAPAHVLNRLRRDSLPGELDVIAAQARSLREWFRGFVNKHKSKPLSVSVLQYLEPLNRVLARDEVFGQIAARDRSGQPDQIRQGNARAVSGLAWHQERRWRSPESLIFSVAQEIASVICDEDFALIKACEGHSCTLMFVDRTKSHRRRWCSMAVCGNRAKQAAMRERLR